MTDRHTCAECARRTGEIFRGLCNACYLRARRSGEIEAPFFPLLDVSWHDDALCASIDPDLWFPEKGGSTREAKQICNACPVRIQCAEQAAVTGERFGISGGLSANDRRLLRKAAS